MRIGLGLGVTRLGGGDPVDRALSGFKHVYDARKGSAFTDYGTGDADGTATDVTHSGKWWTFNGSSSRADLFARPSITLGATDEATFLYVVRRPGGNPAANEVVFAYKNSTSAASAGFRTVVNTTSVAQTSAGDGTNSVTKNSTPAVNSGTLCVFVVRFKASYVSTWLNGSAGSSDTSRGSVADATPTTAANARAGAQSGTLANYLTGDIGLVAATQRWLDDTEATTVTNLCLAAWA
jgi:hypothetical protein